ncbi:MAG: thioredoxin family protein [Candidatus Bathyarchaeota archaeon]|nr:thioredoxin family protein [Candidatus Bathyarchaeota archaeon]
MKYDVSKLRKGSESVHDYVSEPSKAKDAFDKRRAEYKLDGAVVKELKKRVKDYTVIVFSAEWCPDCMRNVPVLDLLAEAAGIEVRVFGHIMRDAKSNTKKWAVPPSPPEVDEFKVSKIPYMVVLKKEGEKVGEIVENPPPGKTLEQAILDIVK